MKLLISLSIFIFLVGCSKNIKPTTLNTSAADYFSVQRFGANFFNEDETLERFMAAKKLGLDFIRLTPSKWPSLRPGAKIGEFLIGDQRQYEGLYKKDLDKLLRVLDMVHQSGLKVVLTFLNVPGRMWRQHHNDKPDCRLWSDFTYHDQTADFMTDLSIAISHHPAVVAINPLNEPEPEHCANKTPDWAKPAAYAQWHRDITGSPSDLNILYEKIHQKIRKFNRTISIVLDSSFYATPAALPLLNPLSDDNVLYSFHMYEPYLYTFQKDQRLSYPGISPVGEKGAVSQFWDQAAFKKLFGAVKIWQTMNNIPNHRVMVGEFGIDRLAKGAVNYLRDLIDIFNQHSWHWAFYAFREHNFAKMDYEMGDQAPGFKYWQAIKKKQIPNHRVYQRSQLIDLISNGLGKNSQIRPPALGWNSWNWFGKNVDEKTVEETILTLAEKGLKAVGYEYVVIDGGWANDFLDHDGKLIPHTDRFPHGIQPLADLAHRQGLKLGLHMIAGTHNCVGKPIGSFGREALHFRQLADWGIDFVKLDRCILHDSEDWPDDQKQLAYQKWHDLLSTSARPVTLSMSANQYHYWYPNYGHLGRTTLDLKPRIFGGATFNSDFTGEFLSVMEVADINNRHHAAAGNGYWNDPDMLVVGDNHMTFAEQQTHFALWSLMSAPLMLGLDVRQMDEKTRALISNRDIIAIDQDTYQQGYRIDKSNDLEIWRKLLSNGDAAFLIINLSKVSQQNASINGCDAEMAGDFAVKDIFANKTLGRFSNKYSVTIGPGQSKLLLITK